MIGSSATGRLLVQLVPRKSPPKAAKAARLSIPPRDAEDGRVARPHEGHESREVSIRLGVEILAGGGGHGCARPVTVRALAVPVVVRREAIDARRGREVAWKVADHAHLIFRHRHVLRDLRVGLDPVRPGEQTHMRGHGAQAGRIVQSAGTEGIMGRAHPRAGQQQDRMAPAEIAERGPGVVPGHPGDDLGQRPIVLTVSVADDRHGPLGPMMNLDPRFGMQAQNEFADLHLWPVSPELGPARGGPGRIVKMMAQESETINQRHIFLDSFEIACLYFKKLFEMNPKFPRKTVKIFRTFIWSRQ